MRKEHIIRSGSKTIHLDQEEEGMYVSIHVPGGHLMVVLDKEEALKLLEAVKDIMEGE